MEVVYLLTPTSNHNLSLVFTVSHLLYIFWLLHQTTTRWISASTAACCISFDSYIKPQLFRFRISKWWVVYLLTPTSNHNWAFIISKPPPVVYLLTPTSNHNGDSIRIDASYVVYLLTPTSNHNLSANFSVVTPLYIFWLLHQTTTCFAL